MGCNGTPLSSHKAAWVVYAATRQASLYFDWTEQQRLAGMGRGQPMTEARIGD